MSGIRQSLVDHPVGRTAVDQAETALAAGTLALPGMHPPPAPVRPRPRSQHDHGHTTLTLRPRRAAPPRTCKVTDVLLRAAVTVRRANMTAVIGSGLLASARGLARRMQSPASSPRC